MGSHVVVDDCNVQHIHAIVNGKLFDVVIGGLLS